MPQQRDTYKYQYVGKDGRIKHSGITNDLDRREGELRRQYGAGSMRQVGRRTTREAAKGMGERASDRRQIGPVGRRTQKRQPTRRNGWRLVLVSCAGRRVPPLGTWRVIRIDAFERVLWTWPALGETEQ